MVCGDGIDLVQVRFVEEDQLKMGILFIITIIFLKQCKDERKSVINLYILISLAQNKMNVGEIDFALVKVLREILQRLQDGFVIKL